MADRVLDVNSNLDILLGGVSVFVYMAQAYFGVPQ